RVPEGAVLEPAFRKRGVRDAMVTPLLGESRAIGTLLIGNRLGEISAFDSEDLHLFETLADHVSVALQNGRLEQSLAQLPALGGDELAILLGANQNLSEAREVVNRISCDVRTPLVVHGREIMTRASIGVAVADGPMSAAELLRNADMAMYTAKSNGKDTYEV